MEFKWTSTELIELEQAQVSVNESKSAQMSLIGLKSLDEPKWAQKSFNEF